PDKADISNWIAAGLTAEQLYDVVESIPDWQPGDELTLPNTAKAEEPLPYVDLAAPLADRAWLIIDCIPMFNVSLFSGEGAVGKSIALLQLSAATVLGKDWFGYSPAFGPVLYLAAEDDDDELRRRLDAIAKHYFVDRQDLIREGLKVLSFAGRDATLGKPDRTGMITPTPLLDRVRTEAVALKPKLIVFDTVADTFGGYENDRTQTRQFITLVRGLAIDARAALVMAAHPSLAGLRDDTGLSGSTAWHNSVRARLYLKSVEGGDTAKRVLEIKKNNYGPVTRSIEVRWKDGVYVLQQQMTPEQRANLADRADALFITILRRFIEQNRNVSANPSSTFAPVMFADQDDAKAEHFRPSDFKAAMERLFKSNRIRVIEEGPPSKRRSRIVEVARLI
ncbi:MAG: AAA family ATPase, partial [Rhizobiales bacterium]|nr:AAA family ATPase [Hyphomicrobiales bacterium]